VIRHCRFAGTSVDAEPAAAVGAVNGRRGESLNAQTRGRTAAAGLLIRCEEKPAEPLALVQRTPIAARFDNTLARLHKPHLGVTERLVRHVSRGSRFNEAGSHLCHAPGVHRQRGNSQDGHGWVQVGLP
jgi:hypothetical protein